MANFWLLLTALPDILKLIAAIKEGVDEAEQEVKFKDAVKNIHGAFSAKNSALLKATFSSSNLDTPAD